MPDALLPHSPRSSVADIEWPPVLTRDAASLFALLTELGRTPSLNDDEFAAAQGRQLQALARHASQHSGYFLERLRRCGLKADDLCHLDSLRALPVMTRQEVQSNGATLACTLVPESHGPVHETGTSGSLGQPVIVKRTGITQLFWNAFTVREHRWQERDISARFAAIRADLPSEGVRVEDWGAPLNLLYRTGPGFAMASNRSVDDQIAWLESIEPRYLLTYPTNLSELLDRWEARGRGLDSLEQIRTIGETVTDALRERVRAVLGVPVADTYSSQEFGTIAIQAASDELYHVMAENYIVEVLDDAGEPCAQGQTGRVIVTDLHNYAMPLVRYETGDYAQPGAAGRGPRGLPTLSRIMGRKRNMIVIDGSRRWPSLNAHRYREVAAIEQYQIVQTTPETIEVRLVCAPLTRAQEHELGDIILEALEHPFQLTFSYYAQRIPLGRTGKFEEFMSLVA
ncbi:phenylacetate-CoA ligase [Caballeronia hypogeia]|uniref:Phenylacetate-CoA ligase n=1 Tax=Caballeronia hypogeia TaxID=1777140 RepID=A0A158A3T1_9BURK|nr:phenylacetate-CoA ligase [Caballeronia hypogeia]